MWFLFIDCFLFCLSFWGKRYYMYLALGMSPNNKPKLTTKKSCYINNPATNDQALSICGCTCMPHTIFLYLCATNQVRDMICINYCTYCKAKKIISVFTVTCWKKLGSVGRSEIISFLNFIFYTKLMLDGI